MIDSIVDFVLVVAMVADHLSIGIEIDSDRYLLFVSLDVRHLHDLNKKDDCNEGSKD